ncbi:MAG: IclR family transcriptional regulator [Dethiosulfatibacter sp.]|nr:IclR family transcriptional regulator [Dethiosulfatibacter sp.]
MNSTEKVLNILRILATKPYEFSLTELSKSIDCGKSGTYKILATLSDNGFVSQKTNKNYCLGSVVSHIGKKYDENVMTWGIAKPYMEKLGELTGETISLGIREKGVARVVHRVISKKIIRIERETGITLPVYVTSIGKLLAAYEDFDIICKRLETEPMVKKTTNTITNLEALKKEYEKIRELGYSTSIEETDTGVVSVGAPLRDSEDYVWGCISIGSPKIRINDKILKKHIELAISTADEISSRVLYYNYI